MFVQHFVQEFVMRPSMKPTNLWVDDREEPPRHGVERGHAGVVGHGREGGGVAQVEVLKREIGL